LKTWKTHERHKRRRQGLAQGAAASAGVVSGEREAQPAGDEMVERHKVEPASYT
jgi:hypothetical protein